jgi:hypothetical protein
MDHLQPVREIYDRYLWKNHETYIKWLLLSRISTEKVSHIKFKSLCDIRGHAYTLDGAIKPRPAKLPFFLQAPTVSTGPNALVAMGVSF